MEMSCPITRIKFIKLQVNIFVIFRVRRKLTVNDLRDVQGVYLVSGVNETRAFNG